MPSHLIRLPAERRDQLKRLSVTRGLPIADLIGEWINQEIRAGVLPDTLPGIQITIGEDTIILEIDGIALEPMDAGQVTEFSRIMTSISRTGGAWQTQYSASSLSVERAGSGIRIYAMARGGRKARRIMACSVARDFARLLDSASAAVKAKKSR